MIFPASGEQSLKCGRCGRCVQWLLGSPASGLRLAGKVARIMHYQTYFAAHAYISAQIVIRGPSDPTKPTARPTRPTWPTFRATDQAVTWFCISGNGKADENVMRSFYKREREGVSDDWQRCAASNRPNSRTVQFRRPDLWLTSRWWTAAGEGHFLSLPQPPKSAIHWLLSRPHFPARFTRQRNKAEN